MNYFDSDSLKSDKVLNFTIGRRGSGKVACLIARMQSLERQLENCNYKDTSLIEEYDAIEKELKEIYGVS